jgi:hypothetical protein
LPVLGCELEGLKMSPPSLQIPQGERVVDEVVVCRDGNVDVG